MPTPTNSPTKTEVQHGASTATFANKQKLFIELEKIEINDNLPHDIVDVNAEPSLNISIDEIFDVCCRPIRELEQKNVNFGSMLNILADQSFCQPSESFCQPSESFYQPSESFYQPSESFYQLSESFYQPPDQSLTPIQINPNQIGAIKFKRNLVSSGLKDVHELVNEGCAYSAIKQEKTDYCLPAAFFYCLLKEGFEYYYDTVWRLWATGVASIGNLVIDINTQCKNLSKYKDSGLSVVNWITLAGIKNANLNYGNGLLQGNSIKPVSVRGSTSELLDTFFEMAGATKEKLIEDIKLTDLENLELSVKDNKHVIAFIHGQAAINTYSESSSCENSIIEDRDVVMNYKKDPNHVIVIDGLEITAEEVECTYISWGEKHKRRAQKEHFLNFINTVLVFSRIF